MNISEIEWPSDSTEATKTLIRFFIEVLEEFKIEFHGLNAPDPVEAARAYLADDIAEDAYSALAEKWWQIVNSVGRGRDFQDPAVLKARLALCLVQAPKHEVVPLGENLEWFLQFVWKLGADATKTDAIMARFFASAKQSGPR